ncbi:MAG: hypothetical protein ACLPID_21145 [Beijerinckiaceae bacterium]
MTRKPYEDSEIQLAETLLQGLLDGKEFKQTAYALDRESRKAALARFLCKAEGEDVAESGEERRFAA